MTSNIGEDQYFSLFQILYLPSKAKAGAEAEKNFRVS
jgi:hypothetical protein